MKGQFKEEANDREKQYDSGDLEFIVLPEQVPMFWEAIKYAYARSVPYDKEIMPNALHILLVGLLSGTTVCGVVLTNERKLESIVLLRIVEEEITKDRSLFIDSVYSFVTATQDQWLKKGARLIEFARRENCKRIKGTTGNKKLHEIIQAFGVAEVYRCYSLDV